MKFQFETSKGMCFGSVEDGEIHFDENSSDILRAMYSLAPNGYHNIEGKWLKLALSDDYYGFPEYKIVYID